MQRPSFFLKTKLLPPRFVPDLLERPRLTEKLRSNIRSPLTLIAADAGSGKTTLIADFVRNQARPALWYQLDHTDADPVVFLGYVTRGLSNIFPGFGEAVLAYLSEAAEEVAQFPERAADLLINEILQSIDHPMIVVLDDYHHLGRETIVHRFVDRLLQYASDILHIVITTRDLPPLAVMKRRSQASVLVINRDDLLFTDDEVRELFRSTLNIELSDEQIAEYRTRTHGWVTALQLIRQVAEQEMHGGHDKPVDLSEILKQSEKDIFDYFAEEVFSREEGPTQQSLLRLSLLETLPLETCSEVFPDHRCSALLPELEQKNVFLTVAGEGGSEEEYRLHPLFRDFLIRRLRSEIGRSGIAAERRRIAGLFLESGRWEQGMPFLLDAEDFDEAARIIAERGSELLSVGAFATLGGFARRIPAEFLERYPRGLLYSAEIARIQGETELVVKLLRRAAALFRESSDAGGEAEAVHMLASVARRSGRISDAFVLLDQAEKLAVGQPDTLLKCANTRGLCLISEGKWAEAEQQFRYALDLAEQTSNAHYVRLITHNLALPPGFRGDFGEALRWFRRIFRDEGSNRRRPQEAIGHLNISRLHLYRGELDAVEEHLAQSLEICELFNMKFLRPEIFEAYANYYREKDDAAHAEEFYERAEKAYAEAEIDISTKELWEEKARFLIRRGDSLRARPLLQKLVSIRKDQGNEVGLRTARLLLAAADLMEKKVDGLAEQIRDSVQFFHETTRYYDEALASMLLAETLLLTGEEQKAVPFVQRVLDLSARFDYDHWLRREIRRNPALFLLDEVAERLPTDLRSELAEPAHDIPSTRSEVKKVGPAGFIDLTINVLGPIDIYRDPSTPFASDAWTTKRARDIFCCIATSKHRRVSKGTLIDLFWPDEDPVIVEKNFHPTISHIRKALNSKQTFKQNFVIFRDGAYQLNPEITYVIDTEEFDVRIAAAETAKRDNEPERLRLALEQAHSLYRGEFMPGVYEDWAVERRNYYLEQFARVTAGLAKQAVGERRFREAQAYAAEALKLDPYREDMHRLTLKVLAAQGKAAALKKHFEGMRELLKDELGIEPSAQTLRLASELGLTR